ncbi:MAG: DNA topoisomerase IV subunit A [bacterium]|nr:DNA topoisomerase IV subunit A [bacterium]
MAASIKKKIEQFVEEHIINENLESIVGTAFGRYSKYIIQDRALPDVRDGLKPVQRRILYAMDQLGMASDKPYKKSARIVGEVIGKYHPHGDTSVYDAMVRMSQNWKIGLRLIDMHGNNGSLDGDPAAAMRYTEARLTPYAEQLLRDIDKRTVMFVPNFDDEEYEPVVLPAKFPNLLVNGSMGMATGYATNIPPHNLNEVLDATIYRIDHPSCGVDDLMHFMKGPDFPTGGIVEGVDEIKRAFETGRGRIVMKSKVEVTPSQLIVTEIPYEVNKADLVRKIDDIRIKKKIDGIIEVRDESDREGLRIVVDVLKEISSDGILAYLMKNTELSLSFSYNLVSIQHKSPKLLSLIDVLDSYINHQKEVIRNRSNFDLQKAQKRKHIVEGFLKMVDILDEVIALIRLSTGKKSAMDNLVKTFDFSQEQADAIVSLQLYRLSSTDVEEMRKEALDLQKWITTLQKILKNESELENVIKKELQEINQLYPIKRRSIISENVQKVVLDVQDLVQHEMVMIALTTDGYLKRSSIKSYLATQADAGLKDGDQILRINELSTRSTIVLFTTLGNYLSIPVYKIPDKKWKEAGEFVGSFAPLMSDESILDWLVVDEFSATQNVLLANKEGLIKQVSLDQFVNQRLNKTYSAMPCTKSNPLVSVDCSFDYDKDIVVASKNGFMLKYSIEELPMLSLQARGVKAINLRDDSLIGAVYTSQINKDEILLLTNRGGIKREFTQSIDLGHRPAKGKMYLKSVKTNPYEFISILSTNVFRLKDSITLRVLHEKSVLIIPGDELKPDKYEYGIPVSTKEQLPIRLLIEEKNSLQNYEILRKLAPMEERSSKEGTTSSHPLLPPIEENDDTMMLELEKILHTHQVTPSSVNEEDDTEQIIQQTLF